MPGDITGLILVNEFSILTVLDLLGLPDNRSSALRGRLRDIPALFSTLMLLNLLSSAHSLPTLRYFPSCSLA
jgi:hypothetical protein